MVHVYRVTQRWRDALASEVIDFSPKGINIKLSQMHSGHDSVEESLLCEQADRVRLSRTHVEADCGHTYLKPQCLVGGG